MAKTAVKVQEGGIIDVTATGTISVGDAVAFGTGVGIASVDAVSGDVFALQIEGVFQFTGLTADTFALGTVVYLDNVGGVTATTVSTSNKQIGYAVTEKAGAVAGTVNVKLGF